jgi:restriction system protein
MAKRGGSFAEVQRASAQATRDRQRAQGAAVREQQRLQRESERAWAAEQRAQAAAGKADARERVQAEKEVKRLYLEARAAEVDAMNSELALQLADIDAVLTATLAVDDYVDLEALRQVVEHPSFESKHQTPLNKPAPMRAPSEPVFTPPEPPKGLGAAFGGKKKGTVALRRHVLVPVPLISVLGGEMRRHGVLAHPKRAHLSV